MPVREQAEEVRPLLPLPIAQHDPLLQHVQLRGEAGAALALLSAFSVVAIVAGQIAKLSNNGGSVSDVFSGGFASFLLVFGAIMLVVLLFGLAFLRLAQRYWKRIAQLRPEALRQPERFRARAQPVPYMEVPQPTSVRIHTRRTVMMPLMFLETFVIWFVFFALLFGLGGSRLFIALVTSVLVGLVMSLFFAPFIEKSQEQRIEVTSSSITSRFGGVSSQVRWQDGRLFSSYRGMQLLKRSSRPQVYDLASEQTAVRWIWPHSRFQVFTAEHDMSQQAFDAWMEHLNSYVNAQTHLPLMELDTAEEQQYV